LSRVARASNTAVGSAEFEEIWNAPAMRYYFMELGDELDSRDEVLRVQSLEHLKVAQKTFALLDVHGRLQVNHFPDLSKKMGDKGLFDWAFADKSNIKQERVEAEARMRDFAQVFAKKS